MIIKTGSIVELMDGTKGRVIQSELVDGKMNYLVKSIDQSPTLATGLDVAWVKLNSIRKALIS